MNTSFTFTTDTLRSIAEALNFHAQAMNRAAEKIEQTLPTNDRAMDLALSLHECAADRTDLAVFILRDIPENPDGDIGATLLAKARAPI